MINCSLIISFYNRIDFLKLVLAGVERQTFRNFEIILADDGSNQNVTRVIELIKKQIQFPFVHLWHEDLGFRKNKILNTAIRKSSSGYLIFIDGDCIPHSKFIDEHYLCRLQDTCLTGRRVNLSEKITNRLTIETVKNGYLEKNNAGLIFDGLIGKSTYVEKGIYIENTFLRKYFNMKKRGLLGCNFSIHKADLEKINGFDERYEAPSIGEDSDIQFRLELLNMKIKSLNHIAVQYHLYHELLKRSAKNLELFAEVKKSAIFFTPYGLQRKA
jgi:glycosyltransferase involved in cell wall biosynthesis